MKCEYKGHFTKANWQKLYDYLTSQLGKLHLTTFIGSAPPNVLDEGTRKHWDQFGPLMAERAGAEWSQIDFRLFNRDDVE